MSTEFETIATLRRAPKHSKQIADYLAWVRGERVGAVAYPPHTAAPVRRCERCDTRVCWVWTELRPGAGEWVPGCAEK